MNETLDASGVLGLLSGLLSAFFHARMAVSLMAYPLLVDLKRLFTPRRFTGLCNELYGHDVKRRMVDRSRGRDTNSGKET